MVLQIKMQPMTHDSVWCEGLQEWMKDDGVLFWDQVGQEVQPCDSAIQPASWDQSPEETGPSHCTWMLFYGKKKSLWAKVYLYKQK